MDVLCSLPTISLHLLIFLCSAKRPNNGTALTAFSFSSLVLQGSFEDLISERQAYTVNVVSRISDRESEAAASIRIGDLLYRPVTGKGPSTAQIKERRSASDTGMES